MESKTLGDYIRELRDRKDLSLRELARQLGVSAPFLSDVELGRRYPGEELLGRIGVLLGASTEELKRFDTRESLADFKRLIASNPNLAVAFRSVVEDVKEGRCSAEELARKLAEAKKKS